MFKFQRWKSLLRRQNPYSVDFALGLIARLAVRFLYATNKLVALTGDNTRSAIRQLAPLLFYRALSCFPFPSTISHSLNNSPYLLTDG